MLCRCLHVVSLQSAAARCKAHAMLAGGAVLSLGRIEWIHPRFHAEQYLWPVGYQAVRAIASPASQNKPAPHLCEVIAAADGSGPVFRSGSPQDRMAACQERSLSIISLDNAISSRHCQRCFGKLSPESCSMRLSV